MKLRGWLERENENETVFIRILLWLMAHPTLTAVIVSLITTILTILAIGPAIGLLLPK